MGDKKIELIEKTANVIAESTPERQAYLLGAIDTILAMQEIESKKSA